MWCQLPSTVWEPCQPHLSCLCNDACNQKTSGKYPIRNLEKKDFDPVALPVGQIRVAVRVGRRSTDLYPIDTTTAFKPASKTLPHSFGKWNLMSQEFIRSRNLQKAFTNMIPRTHVFSVMGLMLHHHIKSTCIVLLSFLSFFLLLSLT